MIVHHGISRCPKHELAQTARNHRSRGGPRCEPGGYVREAPAWGGIPQILDSRIVIDRYAKHDARIAYRGPAPEPHLEVIPRGVPLFSIVSHLHKCADMLGDTAAVKEADLIDRQVVVRTEVICRRRALVLGRVSKAALHHERDA